MAGKTNNECIEIQNVRRGDGEREVAFRSLVSLSPSPSPSQSIEALASPLKISQNLINQEKQKPKVTDLYLSRW